MYGYNHCCCDGHAHGSNSAIALAADVARLFASTARGGIALVQAAVGGLVWGHCCGGHSHHDCCEPLCRCGGHHHPIHHYTIECYPCLPRGGCHDCC